MITVGTAVGAGMFSLPVVSAGMWFSWSIVCLLVSWFCMYQISLMILEVNLNFKIGDSFDTMVRGTLGKGWSIINGLAFAFLLYILDYAYISGGGSIVTHTLVATTGYAPPQMISGLMLALFFSFIVWLSTRAVARVITILIVSMVITFILATSDLFLMVDIAKIVSASAAENQSPFIHFLFAALPYYLTAFGFYSVVPSLVKLYGKNPEIIRKSMLAGSASSFVIYILWLIVSMGLLERAAFLPIIVEGGNVGILLARINEIVAGERLIRFLNIFANMALISSFLGVSLSLFDFISDRFDFTDSPVDRTKCALIAFLPPTFGALIFPDGFLYAIGFAGLVLTLSGLVIVPLMLRKSHKKFAAAEYQVRGGSTLLYVIIALGLLYATFHVLAMLELLPVYGH